MSAKNLVSPIATRYSNTPPRVGSSVIIKTPSQKTTPPLPVPTTSAFQKTKIGQVKNRSGAWVGKLDVWQELNRFLILGTSENTYYATSRQLTKNMAAAVRKALKHNGIATVERIVEISQAGAAPKNDPALLALALCVAEGDNSTKAHAMNMLPKVARTGTHLFDFLTFAQAFRGWGRTLKEGVANWYTSKELNALALQMVKYRQRNGWSHRDVLRLAHPKASSESMNNLFKWAVKGPESLSKGDSIPEQVIAFEKAKTAAPGALCNLILDYRLTWEMIPTEMLNHATVLETLLQNMNLEATVRNLPRISQVGLFSSSSVVNLVSDRLSNPAAVKAARYHPLKALVAKKTYMSGRSLKGSGVWSPNNKIVNVLDTTFYLGFDAVEPTGKRILLGLDVSGSMAMGQIAGMPIAPYEAVAAMAMVTARCEPNSEILGFCHKLQDLGIRSDDRLEGVLRKVQNGAFGSTNPGLLIQYARSKGNIDGLVIYTDNEVNHGSNVAAEMKNYRSKEYTGDRATLTVVGMTASKFTIADPKDPLMMDVVGFDTAAPAIISQFISGKID